MPFPDDLLAPVTISGNPAEAFATHRVRGDRIARQFAVDNKLASIGPGQANEDNVHPLIAHAHMLSIDPDFKPPGEPRSATAIQDALFRLNKGNGLVGTKGASTDRDYDMAIKGLIILLYRYRDVLNVDRIDFIMRKLIPDHMFGGHSPSIEIVEQSFLNIDSPETENHLLMIESSRYLLNQLKHDMDPQATFDNVANGLRDWLLKFLQVFLRHDFLEFNSRPYQRLALHPLLNLFEFARDSEVQTAARLVLDYSMMKIALSSNRGRRVTPFRREQFRITHRANHRNFLYSNQSDEGPAFLIASTGLLGADGKPAWLHKELVFNGLLTGLSTYRPPPAVYILALVPHNPPSIHRFFHGNRPMLPTGEPADSGLEIYNSSPSFLITAGGSFLNSGYGSDEIDLFDKEAWQQTSRAQATTVIPTKADVLYCDLVRFEPYPDPQVDPYNDDPDEPDCHHTDSVNYGVVRNFAAGANLRPAERITVLEESTSAAPSMASHTDRLGKQLLLAAWKGSGNDNINVARVQCTDVMGIPGVEGVQLKTILAETSDTSVAVASHGGRVFIAWKGSGNDQLNIAVSTDDGLTFIGKKVLPEASEYAPALASHNGHLFLAWTGLDEALNVARVVIFTSSAGGAGIEELEDKVTLDETSEAAPALCSHKGRLFLGWKGSGNDNLNLMFSDEGAVFGGKKIFSDTSSHGPALAAHTAGFFLCWKGSGNENLNVARVDFIGSTAGSFVIEGLSGKVTLSDFSEEPPAIASWKNFLCIGWKGESDDNLDFRISQDARFEPQGPWLSADRSNLGYYLIAYRAPPTHPEMLAKPLDNLGFVYIVEKSDIDQRGLSFNEFVAQVKQANPDLPTTFNYGGHYEFKTIDQRTISIWFEMVELKYTPRVVDLTEAPPIDDFTSLALVSGMYMRSPGGHDGMVELRHPGCEEAPIQLDFRNPLSPKFGDNRADCSAPYIDRVGECFKFSRILREEGMHREAMDAIVDGIHEYDALLGIPPEPNGRRLGSEVVQALDATGLDYGVARSDLETWLLDSDDTPYPAFAQAILLLGIRLKAPVYVDVVVASYEGAAGAVSPRIRSDVETDRLKTAILDAWNTRYIAGLQLNQFDQILR